MRQPGASLAVRLLARGVLSYAAATRTLARWTGHSIAGLEGLLSHGLTSEEREALTVAINHSALRGDAPRRALFEWEQRMFAQELPSAPACVLLGGAGDGAEAMPLRAAGYEVHAFEPAEGCLPLLRAAVGPCGSASLLGYRDLLKPSAAYADAAARIMERRYDAVILGWISVSYMLDAHARELLIERLAKICPHGPILLSFNLISDREPPRRSRAFELGARAGAKLGKLRRLPTPEAAEQERFWPHSGFVHLFTKRELERLARAADRELSLREGPHAHAVLRAKRIRARA